jgi:hypothetical protein
MSDGPQVLLGHHLKALKLPTFLREHDKLARRCAAEGGRVEERRGGGRLPVAVGGPFEPPPQSGLPWLRLPSPLVKPDVRISRIRLSDWLHLAAVGGGPTCTRRSRSTPSSPKTLSAGNRRVPRDGTLWRRTRKPRTDWST